VRELYFCVRGSSRLSKPVSLAHLGLDETPEAYRHFDNREEGRTKVVFEADQGLKTTTATGGGLG
jgi:hypothetical protein